MTTITATSPTLRLTMAAQDAGGRLADYVDGKLAVLDNPEDERYGAVLIAVIVLIGVFVIAGIAYLYLCTRAGYSRVNVSTQILKKWGVPYGIKGFVYCS